jgi:type I restriction-modification system DNA methylase subunit
LVSEENFADKIIKSFKNISKEIEKGSSEHDVRYRFVKYFVEEVLGYEPKYIKWEKKRADLTIIDENDFAVVKIETKKPKVNINKPEHEEQAFKYEEEVTRYIGLTNFLQLKIWEIKRKKSELKVDIDFAKLLEEKKSFNELSSDEKSQILFLNNLTKKVLFDPSKYEKFDETYARIDITHDAGFNKLLDRLNYIANTLLYGYTIKSFGEYKEGYGKYQEELRKAEMETKSNGKNHDLNHSLAKYKQKLDEKYERYKTFSGYELWKEYSGKEGVSDDEIKEIFCKETIYVFLNKLLFLRICEDKGLLEKNISNGGIEELRGFLKKRFKEDVINKEILEIAFKSARGLYSHFYETGILDWFRTGDGELNELLNRVLWNFNQFDFTHVDRDILGSLYEKYLPGKERKRLGEFYTPVEIIDYILTSVGYTYSKDIETKDILDPACGSGGFLVRASRRLISRYLMKFGKTDRKELRDPKNWKEIVGRLSPDEAKIILESIQEHIYGLDINPFACHIAEMNLLFQTIDLFQKVRENDNEFKLDRFKIYRTNSLEKVVQRHLYDFTYATFLEEQEEIDSIKQKKFDFVVGNPPYVRVHYLDERTKKYIIETYDSAYSNFDLYIIFIEQGINWLKENGKFGYIVSNQFMTREYGRKLRGLLSKNVKIRQLIDFTDSGVFKDAINYPLIITVDKSSPEKDNLVKAIKVRKSKEDLIKEIYSRFKEKEYSNEFLSVNEINQKTLSEDMWKLLPQKTLDLLTKLDKNCSPLKSLLAKEGIVVGVQTGLNEAFILREETITKYRLEKDLIQKLLDSKDVRRWKINWSGQYLIYPYIEKNGKTILIDENSLKNDYPNTFEYLNNYKDRLLKRWGGRKWYELVTARTFELFQKKKILTPTLSNTNNFNYDANGFYFAKGAGGSYGIILEENDKNFYLYILALLNSSLINFYLKLFLPVKSGGWYEYNSQFLEKIPIKIPIKSKEKEISRKLVNHVEKLLEFHSATSIDFDNIIENEETVKLCNIPRVTFSISDDTELKEIKLDNEKIYLNSEDFFVIKDELIQKYVIFYLRQNFSELLKEKNIKSLILNLKVPISDDILKEISEKSVKENNSQNSEISKIEQEIDQLVYELYNLNKDEINIIEKF